jgi:large subunit ribosomal protein L1
MDVTKAVNDIKAGQVAYRVDKAGIVHAPIGKVSFDDAKLIENFTTLQDTIAKARPAAVKGTYIQSLTLTSTFGPGITIDVASF